MIRIGFFGTPHLSARVLEDFLWASDFEVAVVVTGEDKPIGRHQTLTANPVKEVALAHNLPILQPARIRGNVEFIDTLDSYGVDYFVVVAYGEILPNEVLAIPKKYPINIHGSILPKYRGASPIQSALIAWDSETGVTIMVMGEKMDEGASIDIAKIQISSDETTETLFKKFEEISGTFALDTIKRLDANIIAPIPQDHPSASYCRKITKEEGLLDFNKDAKELYHLYQGLTPWPGVYAFYKGKKLIIEKCTYAEDAPLENIGEITRQGSDIWVVCGKWILTLSQVKLEWKKSQSIKEFLNGQQDFVGSRLSSSLS